MHKWSNVKKELNIPDDELRLAQVKLRLSEFFYDLRKSKKLSQKDLADAIGVSQPYIAKVEDGEENLTVETIVKILDALDTCIELKTAKHKKSDNPIFRFLKAA